MIRLIVCSILLLCSACAYTIVKPVSEENANSVHGYRYYEPMPILLAGCTKIAIVFVPDYSRGYAVQPRAWLSKNDFEIKLENALLTESVSKLDSTALPTLFQALGSKAIESAAKLAALSGDTVGQFSRRQARIYRFSYDAKGTFTGLVDLGVVADCPVDSSKSGGSSSGGRGATPGKSRS